MSEEKEQIEMCFWCGGSKDGDVTKSTLGKQPVIKNYDPCPNCKDLFSKGYHVIGVTDTPLVEGMFPISKEGDKALYPTGSMFVAGQTFIDELLSDPEDAELKERVLEKKLVMLPDELVSQIIKDAREQNVGEDMETFMNNLTDEEKEELKNEEENLSDQGN